MPPLPTRVVKGASDWLVNRWWVLLVGVVLLVALVRVILGTPRGKLMWHRALWLIDHGASLWWHHTWRSRKTAATRELRDAEHHVLLSSAGRLDEADARLAPLVDARLLHSLLSLVPDAWLVDDPGATHGTPSFSSAEAAREAYVEVLTARLDAREHWLPSLERLRRAAADGGSRHAGR